MPEESPDHHAPTQIQTSAHRPAAAGGPQINGTINVTNPDTIVLGPGIATVASDGRNTIPSTADVDGSNVIGDDLWGWRTKHGSGGTNGTLSSGSTEADLTSYN